MHHDGLVEFDLTDLAELYGIAEPGHQQRPRARLGKVTGSNAWNDEKQGRTPRDYPESRPHAHAGQGPCDLLNRRLAVSFRTMHVEAHERRDKSDEEQKQSRHERNADRERRCRKDLQDRKNTRLNSSHLSISYAVF